MNLKVINVDEHDRNRKERPLNKQMTQTRGLEGCRVLVLHDRCRDPGDGTASDHFAKAAGFFFCHEYFVPELPRSSPKEGTE